MSSSGGIGLQLEVVRDFRRLHELKGSWQSLSTYSREYGLYQDLDFLASWWEGFGVNHSFHLMVVTTDTGELVAASPMLVERATYRGIPLKVLRFLENGYVPSCGMLLHTEYFTSAVVRICEHLFSFEGWDMVSLAKLPESGGLSRQIVQSAVESGLRVGRLPSIITPVIDTQGSWDDYLKTRTTSFRKQLRGKVNRFNREPGATIRAVAVCESNVGELVRTMSRISASSWKAGARSDLGSDPKAQVFLEKLLSRLAVRNAATVWFAYKEDLPIAFELHLHPDMVTYPLRADFDESYKTLSPGSVLEAEIIKQMFASERIRTYYSCGMDYRYLMRWTDTTLQHETIEIFAARVLPMLGYDIEYGLMPLVRSMRKWFGENHPPEITR